MDNIRIAVLSAYDKVCAFLDNEVPGAMHYYDDELHEYLKGAANTYSFKTSAFHEESVKLVEGNKLAFRYQEKDYYFNIVRVTRNESEVEAEAYSLNFELLNEQKGAYKAVGAMKFEKYLDAFDFEKVLKLGRNEVSDKSITHEWTGTETMLARMFSLAAVFDAEVEFRPALNEDYSLKHIILNVYRKHTDTVQGIGTNRTDLTLRYGENVSGVTKKSSIVDLYTSIKPIGRDGLTVGSLNMTEYDAEGKTEYRSPSGSPYIMAVQAKDRFPSNLMANANERYIMKTWEYDTDNVNMLYGQGLAQLKENCVPQVEYEVEGYFDTGIGDTVVISDEEFNPPLYLRARVTQQTISFTDPSQNKTTFDNFKELQSQIDTALLDAMQKLLDENKTYSCSIVTDNGIVFKNGEGATTLTASIMDAGKDMTDSLTIQWTLNGKVIAASKSVTVQASDISGKAVYHYDATDKTGISRGSAEVTVLNVDDGASGQKGEDAYTLRLSTDSYIFSADSSGNLVKDISVSTAAIGFKGDTPITPVIGTIVAVNGMVFSVSGATVTITAKKGNSLADSGTVEIPVTLDGIACTLTFSYAKAKAGASGNDAKLCNITGDQVMKYTSGSTPEPKSITLTAEYQNTVHGKWQYKNAAGTWTDFTPVQGAPTISITEDSEAWVGNTACIRAMDSTQTAVDTMTLAKLRDGTDAIIVHISSVNGFTFKNTGVSTIMTATVIVGETIIDTSAKLREKFGSNAKLIWSYKNVGETKFTHIDRSDPRFSDDGFIFTLSPQDVYNKITLDCGLEY